jgi:hypothetical protein
LNLEPRPFEWSRGMVLITRLVPDASFSLVLDLWQNIMLNHGCEKVSSELECDAIYLNRVSTLEASMSNRPPNSNRPLVISRLEVGAAAWP